jgi:hypothetical protein
VINSIESKMMLLQNGGYDIYSLELMRKVFPRIIREAHAYYNAKAKAAGKKKAVYPSIRDIVPFYFLLTTYVNNEQGRDVYGTAFLTYEQIMEHLCIDRARVKWLADILEANGLISKVTLRRKNNGKQVRYSPRYFLFVSPDGYVVDEKTREKIVPPQKIYDPPSGKRQ